MRNNELVRKVIQKHLDIVLAILFGSIANGSEHFDSDIDLAVDANRPLSPSKKMQMIMDLAEAFGRPVDLVDLSAVGEPLRAKNYWKRLLLRLTANQASF